MQTCPPTISPFYFGTVPKRILHPNMNAVRDQSSISLADEVVFIHPQSLLTICHVVKIEIARLSLLFLVSMLIAGGHT